MSNEYVDRETKRKFKFTDVIILIIFMALVAGVVLPVFGYGYSNPIDYYKDTIGQMTSEKLSGTVYLKNVPIYLEGNTGFTQYDLDKWTEEVPDVLLQNCTGIYICQKGTNSTCDRIYATINGLNSNKNTAGFVVSNDNNLYLYVNHQNTVVHELMHLYNRAYGLDKTQQVIDLYTECSAYLNSNAQSNTDEFLSESAELYFINPKNLQTSNLQPIYDYFQSLFHYYA